MSKLNEESSCSELLQAQAQAQIWHQTLSFIKSATLICAVELGIPDVIHNHGKPMTLPELAQKLPINQVKAHFLDNLMRVLVNSGFITQEKALTEEEKEEYDDDDNATYALTPASRLFLKDDPLSARAFMLVNLDPRILKPWQFLGDWFLNDDRSPFDTAYETGLWACSEKDPIFGRHFNEVMAEDSRLISEVLMKECKGVFESLTSLVDIAGGTGTTARAIAQTLPNLKCIVLDLPHVANLNGSENLEFVGGDMFQAIPTANAILLKWILHTWSDEDCVKILKKCKEAIPSKKNGGKVIIIDIVMENKRSDDNEAFEAQSFFDMLMVMLFGSKERTRKEWAKLLSDAGFSNYKVTPLLGLRSIIEAYP